MPGRILTSVCTAVLIVLGAGTGARAEITVGGVLPFGVTTLTASDTYRVTAPLVVPPGAELVIEPGTILRLDTNTGIRVEGSLVARGTVSAPIVFTSSSARQAPGSWGFPLGPGDVVNGIAFVDAVDAVLDAANQYQSGSVLEHTIVEYGTGVSIVRSAPLVQHNVLRLNQPHGSAVIFFNGGAPAGSGDQPVITGNRIEESAQYGFNLQQGTVRFERNLVWRTRGGFVGGVGGTIVENTIACNGSPVFGPLVDRAVLFAFANPVLVQGNSFIGNTPFDVALRFDSPALDLSNNYWGIVDAEAIAARIFDGADSPGLALVDADPVLDAPMPMAPVAPPCAEAPVAVADEYTMTQATTLTVAAPGLLTNDTADEVSGVEFVTLPAGTLQNSGNGGFVFTPPASFVGTATFQYVIHAASGDSNLATVTISVSAAAIPEPQDDAFTIDQDTTLSVSAPGLRANDGASADWDLQFVTFPTGQLTNLGGTGAFTYTPPAGFVGSVTFDYVLALGPALVTDPARVTITVRDTAPPVISHVTADPRQLWPANGRMVPVTVSVNATDNSGSAPECRIVAVASNETSTAIGSRSTPIDWEIFGALTVNLRAERSGRGTGRLYSIRVSCRDAAGNVAIGVVTVDVPRNQ